MIGPNKKGKRRETAWRPCVDTSKTENVAIRQKIGMENRAAGISKAEFLDEIQTKGLRVFLLAVYSHLCSNALTFLFFQTHATSYSFHSSLQYTVKEKGGQPDRKPYPHSLWLKKSI
jgi:hypothetical protein